MTPGPKRFLCGGAIDPARQVYVARAADRQAWQLLRDGNHVNLHAGRQAGKTSLMLRLKDQLSDAGHLCLDVEMTVLFNRGSLLDGLYLLARKARAAALSGGCSLSALRRQRGDTIEGVTQRLLQALVEAAGTGPLADRGGRLFLMLDEVDILMRFPPDEGAAFFLALREFLQRPDRHGGRIGLLLVSVLTPSEIIYAQVTGGISIGFFRDLALPFFDNTPEVRGQLRSQGFADHAPVIDSAIDPVIGAVLDLTGGQPFLTALLCQELQNTPDPGARLDELRDEVLTSARSLAHNHLFGMRKQVMDMRDRAFAILQTYKRVLRDEGLTPTQGGWNAASLENIGLLRLGPDDHYRVANPIYRARFDLAWAEELQTERETASLGKSLDATGVRLFDRRVALILCGGTVGMVTRDGRSGFRGAQDVLMEFIRTQVGRVARVEVFPLYQMDGINMAPSHWLGIAQFIDQWWDHYDGFVVAQGTDTLAFTASAVAYMLGRVNKPVVFTGAQTTVDVLHGDAHDNLIRACYAAAHPIDAVHETQVCFGDQVLRAVRVQKADDRKYQGFVSPGWPPLAQITENLLVDRKALLPAVAARAAFRPYLAQSILLIELVPGLWPDDYRELLAIRQRSERPVQGLFITTPGLGNIPSEPPYNFRPLIQHAIAACIPVLISSQVPINPYTQSQYELASVPAEYGAILAGNLTVAAALTKFAWVIGGVDHDWAGRDKDAAYLDEVKRRMRQDYIGEETTHEAESFQQLRGYAAPVPDTQTR